MEQATLDRHAVNGPEARRSKGIIAAPQSAPGSGTAVRKVRSALPGETETTSRLSEAGPTVTTAPEGGPRGLLPEPGIPHPDLDDSELQLLAEIATGVTTDVAARHLELSARTLRRRLRTVCDRLGVNTPIEAVVWAARRQLI